jgi:hypothetical protein
MLTISDRLGGVLEMKHLFLNLIAATALVRVGGTAMAADMPLNGPVYQPPVVTWTGFYIGAHAGGYSARQSATTAPFPSPGFGAPTILGVPGFGNLPTAHDFNSNGAFGAVHAGYNWQSAKWLLGIEGDGDFLHRSASNSQMVIETFSATPTPAFNMQVSANNNYNKTPSDNNDKNLSENNSKNSDIELHLYNVSPTLESEIRKLIDKGL